MLLHLHDDIGHIDLDNDIDSLNALENIFAAAYSGEHLITASRQTLQRIGSSQALGNRSRAVLKQIINWLPQHSQLKKLISVSASIEFSLAAVNRAGPHTWRVPLKLFSNLAAPVRTLVLAENLLDCDIYQYAAGHYKTRRKFNGLSIALRKDGGGGSTVPKRFDEVIAARQAICLCVTDSDRLSPDGPTGTTSKKCHDAANDAEWIAGHFETTSRELENVIPPAVLDHGLEQQPAERWRTLRDLLKIGIPTLRSHADLKQGVTVRWVLKMPTTSPDREYWDTALAEADISAKAKDCWLKSGCGLTKEEPTCPDCTVYPGVAENLAEAVSNWLTNRPPLEAYQVLEAVEEEAKEWLEIGQKVFEFCCAMKPMRL